MSTGHNGHPSGRGSRCHLFPPHLRPFCLNYYCTHFLPQPLPPGSHQQFLVLGLKFAVPLLRTEPRTWVRVGCRCEPHLSQSPPPPAPTLTPSLVRWGPMALTSLWKMLCCSTWWSTSGRSVPKLWPLSWSWEGRRKTMHAGGGPELGTPPRKASQGLSKVAPRGTQQGAVTFIYTSSHLISWQL